MSKKLINGLTVDVHEHVEGTAYGLTRANNDSLNKLIDYCYSKHDKVENHFRFDLLNATATGYLLCS